jgi:hypothetical protein
MKTISYGDSLYFFNADPMARDVGHTVTHLNPFGPPLFDTGVVAMGAIVKIPGAESLTPQRYLAYCKINPEMEIKIHVVGGGFGPG